MDLWQTLITTAVGAFLGSGAAFAANLLAGRIRERRREWAALDELSHEIHFRRVLRRIEPVLSPRAEILDPDYEKARHSAATLRREIRRARRALVSGSPAAPDLDSMTLACNTFLDESEDDPARYQLQLMQLQWRLAQAVHSIAARSPRIGDLEPGDATLAPTAGGSTMPTSISDI
jgi:hypothetical protein